jgi:hypothetical protein
MGASAFVLEAIKVGAIGVVGVVLAYTASLLRDELALPKVRPPARRMIYTFMGFCVFCLLVAGGLEVWKITNDKAEAEKTGAIRMHVRAIDNALDAKIKNEIETMRDRTLQERLLTFTNQICDGVKGLAIIETMDVHECKEPPRLTVLH